MSRRGTSFSPRFSLTPFVFRLLAAFSKVLHVKNVMQCAVLEEFSMFLVLADHVRLPSLPLSFVSRTTLTLPFIHQSLFAYQLEALVPSSVPSQNPSTQRGPERLSGTAHVLFFSVGQLSGRTLVAYCKKKQLDSVFRVLEPIPLDARGDHGRRNFFGGGGRQGASFRVFKVGFCLRFRGSFFDKRLLTLSPYTS